MAEGNKLTQMLKGSASPPKAALEVSPTAVDPDTSTVQRMALHVPEDLASRVVGIEVEAVVGGVLQRIRLAAGTNPSEVHAILLGFDANVKVRDEFPSKGMGGKREVKEARAIVINARVTDSGKFIDLVCANGEDLSVTVSKKSADTFVDGLKALGKVGAKNLAKIEKAFAEKGSATVILSEPEQFGVRYWLTDDHRAFLDSMTPEPPAVTEKETASE